MGVLIARWRAVKSNNHMVEVDPLIESLYRWSDISGVLLMGMAAAAFPQVFAFSRVRLADAPGDLAERAVTVLRSVFSQAWVVGPGLGAEPILAAARGAEKRAVPLLPDGRQHV